MSRVALLTSIGITIGVLAAVWLSNALRSLLFEVTPGDPTTVAAAVAALAVVALVAAWLPARRAAAVQPAAVLRLD